MANKKINQLVAKTTIQSTDLFPLGDASTGQLFKKTIAELQAAIGGAVISVNGLVGTVVLDTDDIQELATPTNKYFTDARARSAISLTVTGNSGASTYSNSTGVLNVPTYTLAGLGGITASFLSGGSGITYNSTTGVIAYSGTVYTDASIRALFSAGTGISYNSSTGAISYSGTVYTDASIRALISLTTTGNSGVSSYNNTTGVLNVPNYTLAGLGGISFTSLSGTAPITYNSSTGAIGITQANTSTNGFLSSTDWNTFNGKQSTLTLGNVTEVASNVLLFPDGGTNKTVGNLSIQVVQAGASTNGYLSSSDWTTFNNKQATVTLTTTGTTGASTFSAGTLNIPQYQGVITVTTTGTSGAATLTSNTLNIPQYQAVLTNPVTGTGTTNYVSKFTSSSAIGISQIFDNGTNVGINTTSPAGKFSINTGASNQVAFVNNATSGGTYNIISLNGAYSEGTNMSIQGGGSEDANLYVNSGYTSSTSGAIVFRSGGASAYTERVRISPTGAISTNGITSAVSNVHLDVPTSNNNIIFYSLAGSGKGYIGVAGITGSILNEASVGDIVIRSQLGKVLIGTYISGAGDAFAAITVANNRNVGIGNSNPLSALSFGNVTGNKIDFYNDGTVRYSAQINSGELRFYTSSTSDIISIYAGNTAGIIVKNGRVLINTTTDNGEALYVSGSIRATGSITANSDVRLKKNIERIENALQKVSEISGYTYNTIYDEDRHAGVIAQEIDKVLPEIVNKGNDGLMGVEYGNISALLIEAIKDLKKDNESLRAIVEGLTK
jgi:hypothetical protein